MFICFLRRCQVEEYMKSPSDRRRIPPLVAAVRNRLHLDANSARLMTATALLECRTNQNLLFDAVHGLCVNGSNGIALVLLGRLEDPGRGGISSFVKS